MGQIRTTDDVKQLGTILSVWAHPDDESFSLAGIMAAAVANGQKVICVTATKGEAGVQDESRWPAAQLGDIRAKEMAEACKILGITDHHWLGYHDGDCDKIPEAEAIEQIKAFIDKYKPNTIFTFGPEGLTGHSDHKTVSHWVDLATEGTNVAIYHLVENEEAYENYLKELDRQFNIYFNIDMPPVMTPEKCDIALELSEDLIKKKHDALAAMPSQTEAMLGSMSPDVVSKVFAYECYIRAN